ncbi:MAG: heavy metal translocating P-type ATPase [Desulfobacteraceae bacterium]
MGSGTTLRSCDLCGLPLRYGNHSGVFGAAEHHFCCGGCLMVYTMLTEAADSPDPAQFKQSDLYRRCVAAGVVPASESKLADAVDRGSDAVAESPLEKTVHGHLSLHLEVEGMWCPACSWVIESALGRIGGVEEAACDFATDRLRCRYDPVRVDPGAIVKTVEGLGYRTSAWQGQGAKSIWRGELVRLLVSALLSVNVMMLSWSLYSGVFTSLSIDDIRYISWPIAVMATGVMFFGGGPLFRRAWLGLRAGAPGMEVLVCMGAASAYLYSLYNFWEGSWHLYFDTASMLITLVLLGKLLEAGAKARVRRDLEGFLTLQPNKVRLCSDRYPQGRFVALEQLVPGDTFRIVAGEMVPADGRVIRGGGLVDETAVTGESRPKKIEAGHPVTSGCRLIKGQVTVAATRVGRHALLGQMISTIETALSRQTPLESRTDRWLALFVPVMVGLAAATVWGGHMLGWGWEQAFVRGLTVLVIACPCALGIAIPLARIAGMSGAGQRGILVRDFEAFERVDGIRGVVLDKTGTLTHGRWSLEQLDLHGEMDRDEVLAVAAGLEKGVDHAVARGVLDHAAGMGIVPAKVDDVITAHNGVAGIYQGGSVRIGTWDFVSQKRQPELEAAPAAAPLSQVYMGVDDQLCATLHFGDRVWETASGLIDALKGRGLGIHLISGDTPAATQGVGKLVGIDNVQGGLLPTDKAEYIVRLQARGRGVVMVGDGVNDAPALAKAELSVAVHRDASLAQQAANVTLMRGDPAQLIEFFTLARQVNAKVTQNLGCAWIYNLISIPIAMSGLLNPLIAATAMLLSSLTVIGNTLLLVRRR